MTRLPVLVPDAVPTAADRLEVREIAMPAIGLPELRMHAWQVKPGETFAAQAVLGEVRFIRRVTDRLLARATAWADQPWQPRYEHLPVTAPETGILTWQADLGPLDAGDRIATYIPLPAWQHYEALLAEHDQLFGRQGMPWLPPAAASAPSAPDDLAAALDALLDCSDAITARALRADRTALVPLLVRQLRTALRCACPVPPDVIAAVFHSFCLVQSIDERLQALDDRHAGLYRQRVLTRREAEDLIHAWLSHKEAIIVQAMRRDARQQ